MCVYVIFFCASVTSSYRISIFQEYGCIKQPRTPELRLKLGEVMMKSCRAHGEWNTIFSQTELALLCSKMCEKV